MSGNLTPEDGSLVHQRQPDQKTCLSACMAMALGKPVEEVIDGFHEEYMERCCRASEYLSKQGMLCREVAMVDNILMKGCLYILCVPSLNHQGGFHIVLGDTRDGEFTVYDPQMGNEGKLYYSRTGKEDDLAVMLKYWIVEVEILGYGLKPAEK